MPIHVSDAGFEVFAPSPGGRPTLAVETLHWRPASEQPPEGRQLLVAYECSPGCPIEHYTPSRWTLASGFSAFAAVKAVEAKWNINLPPLEVKVLAWTTFNGPLGSAP